MTLTLCIKKKNIKKNIQQKKKKCENIKKFAPSCVYCVDSGRLKSVSRGALPEKLLGNVHLAGKMNFVNKTDTYLF